ncbi:hypothetical protein [Gluconobacter oxydans]|uniref:hypothetical protein n=1 Tax=Gluconobacter oxydans TaxID=442 RepID=UPI0039EC997F
MASSSARPLLQTLTGIGLAILGLALFLPGLRLIALGGSFYYAVAGLLMILSGIMLTMGRRSGLALYAALLAYTLIWALWSVGLD